MTVGRSGDDDASSPAPPEPSSLFISSSLRFSSLSEPSLTATVASSSSKESSLSSSLPSDHFSVCALVRLRQIAPDASLFFFFFFFSFFFFFLRPPQGGVEAGGGGGE